MLELRHLLRPGLILNMGTRTVMGSLIRHALRFRWDGRVDDIPNHDAIVVERAGKLFVGESRLPLAGLTELSEYERRIESGEVYNFRILSVTGATEADERGAADWWLANVMGQPYDFCAFPRLLWKATVGDWCPSAAGWEWAWYCTEGVRDAYQHGSSLDPWGKDNPTPLTTLKRALERKLTVDRYIDRRAA